MDLPNFDVRAIQVEDQRGADPDAAARSQAISDFLTKLNPVLAVQHVVNAVRGEQPVFQIKPTLNAQPYTIDLRKGLPPR